MPSYDPNGNEVGGGGGITITNIPLGSRYILSTDSATTASYKFLSPTPQIILTGSGSYSPSNANVKYIKLRMVGGGAAGGQGGTFATGGGGGGSGGFIEKYYLSSTYNYVTGGGGSINPSATGNPGANTTWSTTLGITDTAFGGAGGEGGGTITGGGNGGVTTQNITSFFGGFSILDMLGGDGNPSGTGIGGCGGSNPLGMGGRGGAINGSNASKKNGGFPSGYGSGGGAGSGANNSAPGSDGVIIIEEFYY